MSSLFSMVLRKIRHLAHVDLSKLADPIQEMFVHNWYLGFTSFGGPAVHFQIVSTFIRMETILKLISIRFRRKFVEKDRWIDDQMVSWPPRICILAY